MTEDNKNLLIGWGCATIMFVSLMWTIAYFNSLPTPSALDKCAHSGLIVQQSSFCMEIARQKSSQN